VILIKLTTDKQRLWTVTIDYVGLLVHYTGLLRFAIVQQRQRVQTKKFSAVYCDCVNEESKTPDVDVCHENRSSGNVARRLGYLDDSTLSNRFDRLLWVTLYTVQRSRSASIFLRVFAELI